jgi:hypothetical protein
MNQQIPRDTPSYQNAQQQQEVNPATETLETLLQVLSNVQSENVLQEAATAKEATIDTLISRFEDLTSILKEAKRQRQGKRKYCVNDVMDEQPSLEDYSERALVNRARMPTEVLRQLTQSGFLSTADLAKTLLLTCKCYEIDLGREYVYEYLCRCRWRNITKLPPSLLADRGYYWLFRNMSRGLKKSPAAPPSPIPPPAFDYDQMLFSVSIRDGSGKEIVSEVLCGDQLHTFKDDGNASAILENPIIIGTYPAGTVAAYRRYVERDADYANWSVTVHLFRLDQNKCRCVHESGSCDWEPCLYRGVNAANILVGWSQSSSLHLAALALDEGGNLLLEGRIQEEFDRHYMEHGDAPHFQGIHFDVDLTYRVQHQAPSRPADPSVATVVLEIGELHLVAVLVDTGGDREEFDEVDFNNGITLPHLFEHLKVWGGPDD